MRMFYHFKTLILVALQPWNCATHPSAVIQADGTVGVEADSFSRSKGKHLVRSDRQRQDLGHEAVESTWVNASFLESTMKEVEEKTIDGIKVLLKKDGGKGWVLLMKLGKNDFCYGSARWKDGKAFNPEKMLDTSLPNPKEYDAKSLAFHKLEGIDAVKLQTDSTSFEAAPEVHFKATATAEKLITTDSVGITSTGGFNSKSYWDTWSKAFAHSRNKAPAFMRAGKFVSDPKPECRTNPQDGLAGCGKPCVFCMQAADGNGCPTRSMHNDISKGIGLNAAYCGGGDPSICSTSTVWAARRISVLLWGRLKEMPKPPTEEKSSSAMCRFVIFLLVPGLATCLPRKAHLILHTLRSSGWTFTLAALLPLYPRARTRLRRLPRKIVEIGDIDDLALQKIEQWQSAPEPLKMGEMAEKIMATAKDLEAGLVERSLEARILLLAAFCGEHLLLLGPPGTAKSLLARRLVHFVGEDAVFFERLLTRFSVPEELFGPLSLKGLEHDEYLRKTTGYLPEASIAFVDEIFKANSAILNSLLSIVNERVFDNGPERVAVPLRCLVAASNEAPESEELQALDDRLLFRLLVSPVSEQGIGALIAATSLSADEPTRQVITSQLGLEDAERARQGAATVTVPPGVVDIFKDCRSFLASLQPPELVSDRRLGQAVRMLQVVAWTCGRSQVEICDCSLLAHVFWKNLENRDVFQTWLKSRLVKSRGRQLAAILSGLLDRVVSKATSAADLLEELKIFRKATENEIAEAQRQQQLARAHCWLPNTESTMFCQAVDLELDSRNGARTLLMEVARLSAAVELEEEVDVYVRHGLRMSYTAGPYKNHFKPVTVRIYDTGHAHTPCLLTLRKRRGFGELEWSAASLSDPLTDSDDETFKLGKHKGRLFSEVAQNDVDYCKMVEKKVSEGNFRGDSPLDRQVRAFVAYLKERGK